MTCRRSSHQVSTEELEKRPSRPRQRQPTNQPTTTRTSHAHMQPLGPDLLLEKSNRNREQLSRLSRKAYHLQRLERPLPATTAAAAAAVASRHTPSPPTAASKVCATQVSRVDQTEALLLSIARPCLRVSSRPAKNVLPWCHRKTPPLAQETGARARYLPRCSPAKGVLHPMCIM